MIYVLRILVFRKAMCSFNSYKALLICGDGGGGVNEQFEQLHKQSEGNAVHSEVICHGPEIPWKGMEAAIH